MPSKRKKNKRRMRRVQAQRRALEEQYANSGTGTPRVRAVSAPVPIRVPVTKTSECPVAVPIKTPVAVAIPIDVPPEVPPEVPPVEPTPLEVPVFDIIKDDVKKPAKELAEAPVKPSAEEPAVIEEAESVTIPVTEVTPTDESVSFLAESEIQVEKTAPVATEVGSPAMLQTDVAAEPVETVDTECKAEAVAEVPAEDVVAEVPITEETVATVEAVTETAATEVEPVAEAAVAAAEPAVEVVEEHAVEAKAMTVEAEPLEVHTITDVMENVHARPEPVQVLVEAAVPTEAEVSPEPEPEPFSVEEPMPLVESTSDPIVEDFLVTESSKAVEAAVAEQQIPETPTDVPEVLSETLSKTTPAPEVVPEEIIHDHEFMEQVDSTEVKKDLPGGGGITTDAVNGCLGNTEVAIEG